eukprot:Clim_evm39s230 gene=Clim_evmTU39s230
MSNECRFYSKKFPDIDDVVMVSVVKIAEMGAYVQLLEYNKMEGMILLSELSRRRIRSINKLIRVGRTECVMVLRVDKEKGYIDLSKRRVNREDVKECEDRYQKAKAVHSILSHVSAQNGASLEELYEKTAWKLEKSYPSAYDAFKVMITNPDEIMTQLDIDDNTKQLLLKDVQRRLAPQAAKIRADIQLSCYNEEGIDAIKAALKAGQAISTEELPIKINLWAPPIYVLSTTSMDKDMGITALQKCIDVVKKNIEASGGFMSVHEPPRAISAAEDKALERMMEDLELANQEVPGDDDESSEEDED